jgi:hypothetical protein
VKRTEALRRMALLEARLKAHAGDETVWSVFSDDELSEIKAWCEACGSQPLTAWARTLPVEERWRVRGVLARIAGQSHAA